MSGKFKVLIWKNKCWESQGSNLGDLLIIKAMIMNIRQELPTCEIILFSDNPEYTSKLYNIRSEKLSLGNIFKVIREIDLLIIGGGTVFTDRSSVSIIPINVSLPYLALLFGKPVCCYSIGVGAMTGLGQKLVKGVTRKCSFITLRDEESKEQLEKLGLKNVPMFVTEDAAFSAYKPETLERSQSKKRVIIAPRRIFHYKHSVLPFYLRKKLGLLPEQYFVKMEQFKKMLAGIADYCVEKYNCEIMFLPMYSAIGNGRGLSGYLKKKFSSRDDIICEETKKYMKHSDSAEVIYDDNPDNIINIMKDTNLLIGVPLHSLILSYLAGTPVIGISYQEKVSRFMNSVGLQEFTLDAESIDSELEESNFIEKIDHIMSSEMILREKINSNKRTLHEKSLLPSKLVAKLLLEKAYD